jgi:hypothetical protein
MNSMLRTAMQIVFLCLVTGLFGFALPAAAQERFVPGDDEWELTFNGTGSNDRDFDNGGFGVSGALGYYLSDETEFVLRQSVSYTRSDSLGSDNIFSTRAAIDYHFGEERLRPFLGVNFGGVYGSGVEETFAAAPEVGLKWYARPGVFMMLMGEYQFFFRDVSDADDQFDDGQFVYSLGMGFDW